MEMSEKPKVVVKVKNMPLILDYCVENKIKFSASPRLTPDEWEFELSITDIMGAVALGMFLRENRLEMLGLQANPAKTQAAKSSKVSKAASKKAEAVIDLTNPGLETPVQEAEPIQMLPVEEPVANNVAIEEPVKDAVVDELIAEPTEFAPSFNTVDEFTNDNGSQTNDLLFG